MKNEIKKIMYVVHGLPPERKGGTENYTLNLANELSRKYSVSIVTRIENTDLSECDVLKKSRNDINIYSINNTYKDCDEYERYYNHPGINDKFRNILSDEKPDIVHITYALGGLSAGIIPIAAESSKCIVTLTDFNYICAWGQLMKPDLTLCDGPDEGWNCCECFWGADPWEGISKINKAWLSLKPRGKRVKYAKAEGVIKSSKRNEFIRNCLSRANKVIAPTDGLGSIYSKWGIYNIQILGFGINKIVSIRNKEVDSNNLIFGFIGQLLPHKGLHVIAEAINNKSINQKIEIHIYGEIRGEIEENYLKESISKSGKIMKYMGTFQPSEFNKILSTFDVLIFTSLWVENSPLVVLNAVDNGVPVISSDIPGVKEIISNQTGWLFERGNSNELADIILGIIKDCSIIDKKRAFKGKIKSIKENANELNEIYNEVFYG